jgi:hypothetical protein
MHRTTGKGIDLKGRPPEKLGVSQAELGAQSNATNGGGDGGYFAKVAAHDTFLGRGPRAATNEDRFQGGDAA